MSNKHLGSSFEDFLEEEDLLDESEAIAIKRVLAHSFAIKRVLAHSLEQEMLKRHLSKRAMAAMMKTSRSSLDRLLDHNNTSVTLNTMVKAAAIINKRLDISLLSARKH